MITEDCLPVYEMVYYECQVDELPRAGLEGAWPEIGPVGNSEVIEMKGTIKGIGIGDYPRDKDEGYLDHRNSSAAKASQNIEGGLVIHNMSGRVLLFEPRKPGMYRVAFRLGGKRSR
jgi:hypothetical protein